MCVLKSSWWDWKKVIECTASVHHLKPEALEELKTTLNIHTSIHFTKLELLSTYWLVICVCS